MRATILIACLAIAGQASGQQPIVAANLSVDLNLDKEEMVYISQEIAKKHSGDRLKSELEKYLGRNKIKRHSEETFQQYLSVNQPIKAFRWVGFNLTPKQIAAIDKLVVDKGLKEEIGKASVVVRCETVSHLFHLRSFMTI